MGRRVIDRPELAALTPAGELARVKAEHAAAVEAAFREGAQDTYEGLGWHRAGVNLAAVISAAWLNSRARAALAERGDHE
jgi:hypothetical protein